MKIHEIYDPMFRLHLSFFEGTQEEYENTLKNLKLFRRPVNGQANTVSDGIHTLMWVRDLRKRKWEDALGLIVHELFHLAFHVSVFRGVPLNQRTDETGAYYVEMMFREILKQLKKK